MYFVTGFRPHVVYNNLHRSRLDANREINEATLDVPDAIVAYQNYTRFIEKAKASISGRGLLLDIHGHRHQRTQLGYLISKARLKSGDYRAEDTSIKSLVQQWCVEGEDEDVPCFKNFIIGDRSLGYFLDQEGVTAVPSPLARDPGDETYFSGGFTVRTYGSRNGGHIDAIQMEFPRVLRNEWGNATKFQVASAVLSFFKLNY